MAPNSVAVRDRFIPADIANRLIYLSDEARGMGIRVCASRGAGKSRLLGRVIAWLDLVRGTPLIVLDPVGSVIDNLLDKVTRLPAKEQERLWPRIRYVDLAGSHGAVVPMPLYYRYGHESLFEIAQRPLDVFRKSDPSLMSASVLGWNAVQAIGSRVGMVLAGCGLQITEAPSLLDDPQQWADRLHQAAQDYPELEPAADFFLRQYPSFSGREKEQQTLSFRRKIDLFQLDPVARAQYGAAEAGIDWQQVVDDRQCVLIDCRNLFDFERKRFAILWVYQGLLEWIKRRGPGRHTPLSLIVDELTYLLGDKRALADPLVEDMEELVARLARNHRIWLTLAHQEVNQLSDRINYLLMTCNQILGSTADVDAALAAARRFQTWDPRWVKKREDVWASDMQRHFVIDERTVEYSIDEQQYIASRRYLELPRYTFLVGLSAHEGSLPTSLQKISIAHFDTDCYPDEQLVATARAQLARRDGHPVDEVLGAIDGRLALSSPGERRSGRSSLDVTDREPL